MGCSPWGHKESDTTERLSSSSSVNSTCVRIDYIYAIFEFRNF